MKEIHPFGISSLRGGVGIVLSISALLATAAFGADNLPSVFNATTGYVTLNASDATGADNQSFFRAKNWSDGQAPHAGTNYFVKAGLRVCTPHVDSDVASQLATDATCQTFKGDSLVLAGYLWHLNGTYTFTIPDFRMLPGSYISYTALKKTLEGTLTVYGTKTAPSLFRIGAVSLAQPFGMDVKGGADSCLALGWSQQPPWLELTGDLSDFHGTLTVGESSSPVDASKNAGFIVATDRLGGGVELAVTNASLFVTAANGLTVGGLRTSSAGAKLFLDGAKLNADTPRLTVTNALDLAHPVWVMPNTVTYSTSANSGSLPVFGGIPEPTEAAVLIRLTPACVANGGWTDATLYRLFILPSTVSSHATLLWQDDADGGKTLWLVTCVNHAALEDAQARSSLTFSTKTADGDNFYWDNETNPADDADSAGKAYASTYNLHTPVTTGAVYAFPGKMLLLSSGATLYAFNASYGFDGRDLELRGGGIRLATTGAAVASRKHEDGNAYYTYTVKGGLVRLPGAYSNTLLTYGDRRILRIESELTGSGDLRLTTIEASSRFKNHCGYHEFTALNTNFTGKIHVTATTRTASGTQTPAGYTTPNETEHVRLFVYDERNLGGARDEFAWDALLLDQYSELQALNDVTFTDGWNRGLAIGNIGRLHVPEGLTMTVRRPLNVNGRLVKEGAGTLALGGVLTFGGENQTAAPESGANLMTVAGGAIQPLAAHAFDGLAITFTNNASLRVDGTPSDATLLRSGLVNVKETAAPVVLADNQATLPVTVDFGAATEPPDARWTVGLVTLATAHATALKPRMTLANPTPFQNWRGTLDLVDNGDGTATIVATYKASSLTIILR